MPNTRRIATLLAFAHAFEITAMDDALDVLDAVIADIVKDAKKAGDKERLRTLRDLDAAALQLQQVCRILLDERVKDAQVRSCVFDHIP
jgi:hypothetical protein